jgi:hypothetical protein
MSEPSMDDKIERVVRSLLEAVDLRLAEVRLEMEGLAQQVAQRDAELTRRLTELDQRIERQLGDPRAQATGTDPLAARMEQATQVLLERIEAMHQRTTIATNARLANMHAMIDQLRDGQLTTVAANAPQLLSGLDAMSAPLRVGPITAQQPLVAPVTPVLGPIGGPSRIPALPEPIQPSPSLTSAIPEPAQAPAAPDGDGIDLGRLADLLSERLGHLDLPTSPG